MKLGIVGLPNVGKSTLFNAITDAGADAANYPFCTIDANVGVVTVPDERLEHLAQMYGLHTFIPAAINFVDIAGLVKGASKGEGLGNKFLANIREVDAIVHVVRCFEDDNISHVEGNIDALRDVETVNLELVLADLEMIERRMNRVKRAAKGDKSLEKELELIKRIYGVLEQEKPARALDYSDEEKKILKSIQLLTSKPVIYAANMSEQDFIGDIENNKNYNAIKQMAKDEEAEVLPICAELEAQIADMEDEEKLMFLEELGLEKSGLDRLIQAGYRLLDLISFITAGEIEVHAWTIKNGTKAPQAAGKIHTDFERGFIRAEVVDYDKLMECGSMAMAKEMGLVRSEGKEYIVKDGDVILFRFNV